MEEVVQTYVRDKTFMGTVLVARGNDVILSKGYGSANLEWDIPNTPATKFRLGSVTKQFTAACHSAARGTREADARGSDQEAPARCAGGVGRRSRSSTC